MISVSFSRYIELVKKHGLEISQPGLEPNKGLTWQMTKRRGDREVHKWALHPNCMLILLFLSLKWIVLKLISVRSFLKILNRFLYFLFFSWFVLSQRNGREARLVQWPPSSTMCSVWIHFYFMSLIICFVVLFLNIYSIFSFVEIMATVFSRDAWRCVWHMIQVILMASYSLGCFLYMQQTIWVNEFFVTAEWFDSWMGSWFCASKMCGGINLWGNSLIVWIAIIYFFFNY